MCRPSEGNYDQATATATADCRIGRARCRGRKPHRRTEQPLDAGKAPLRRGFGNTGHPARSGGTAGAWRQRRQHASELRQRLAVAIQQKAPRAGFNIKNGLAEKTGTIPINSVFEFSLATALPKLTALRIEVPPGRSGQGAAFAGKGIYRQSGRSLGGHAGRTGTEDQLPFSRAGQCRKSGSQCQPPAAQSQSFTSATPDDDGKRWPRKAASWPIPACSAPPGW